MGTVTVGASQADDVAVIPRRRCTIFVDEIAVAQVAVEAHQFTGVTHLQAAGLNRYHAIQGDLRQAVVRGDLGNRGHFIGVGIQARGVAVAAPGQSTLLVNEAGRVDAQVGVQVLEVVGVADVGEVHFAQQARVQAAFVLPAVHPAGVFIFGLQFAVVIFIVEDGCADLTFAALGQVATFAFQQQPTIGHIGRIEGGIVVGRQVEVVRRLQGHAVVAGRADARGEEAGLTTVIDREVDIRGVEHRYVFDPQGDVGGSAETGERVQLDVVALQVPGVVARFATGVSTVLETDDGVFLALDRQRVAAHMALVHDVFGVVDFRRTGVQLQLGTVADHQGTLVTQAHVADQLATVFGLVQAGFVSFNLQAGLAQHDITGEGGDLLLLLKARGFGRDEHRRVVQRRVVVHAWARWLDIGAGAVRPGFSQLGGAEFVARHPIEMAIVGAARAQAFALAVGDQCGCRCAGVASAIGSHGTNGGGAVGRPWWQLGRGVFRGAGPAAGGGHLAIKLLGGHGERHGQWLHRQQAASHQQWKFFAERGGFYCHLVFRASCAPSTCRKLHASRWAEKDAG